MAIMKFYSGHTNGEVWENDPENPTNLGQCLFADDDIDGELAVTFASMLNSTYLEGYKDGAITAEVKELSNDKANPEALLAPVLDAFVEMYNYNAVHANVADPVDEGYQKTLAVSAKLWDAFDRVFGRSWRSRLYGYGTQSDTPVTVH